ncbi:hypothetical protein [Dietzia cinnamea]|uniref:Short subunit dehydrogenase n=1 Tax=Dietzia cinnamea TaxID=321318 RepID=A0A4R3ZUM6_9ACTN|nr:hypothetical protein [Dietzia cinnamea]MCT2058950.1 hypothetical protein [Dietzia cinnamea]MCT2062435.1 hypothetical protein [Dietzia cinnamea]MCT2121153.1 hypothetical protein [Dietzia cinnamea]MCT2144074.1 hypothetical protein [Dietzia cinnamea]MCT2236977.1 hypothetical protein [Dietzia cinnamea]
MSTPVGRRRAVVVTGASGGIGAAVARRLAAEFPNAPVVLGHRSTEPAGLTAELAARSSNSCADSPQRRDASGCAGFISGQKLDVDGGYGV